MTPISAPVSAALLAHLRSPKAIRERCAMVFEAGLANRLEHFRLDLMQLPAAADYVVETILASHPDLDIPYHSRWRHFSTGGIDRWASLVAERPNLSDLEKARIAIDLVVPSVLLDAGAGPGWSWTEPGTGAVVARSEGLALASIALFRTGAFSAQPGNPLRADANALAQLPSEAIARAFQVGPENPLIGVEQRAGLLRRLGSAIQANSSLFAGTEQRIGHLADLAMGAARNGEIQATTLFWFVMQMLAPVWPPRVVLGGVPLGDVGRHPAAATGDAGSGLVPFHKLSQWLTYSLLEPLEWLGLRIIGLDRLTGLPEYRNGGFFVDAGVLVPRHAGVLGEPHEATSELVVEWRALTVCLLDRIADLVRERLGRDADSLPLAKVLEGGTWSAGRRIAREKRADGGPPITVLSDGTIF